MWNDGTTKQSIDPCPEGFRVPTNTDWADIFEGSATWTEAYKHVTVNEQNYTWIKIADGASNGPGGSWAAGGNTGGLVLVKDDDGSKTSYDVELASDSAATVVFLPAAGRRYYNNGAWYGMGENGFYASSTPRGSGGQSFQLYFWMNGVYPNDYDYRAAAVSIRCVAE
jgi:uncharacterized protein (TIGR02145 family)